VSRPRVAETATALPEARPLNGRRRRLLHIRFVDRLLFDPHGGLTMVKRPAVIKMPMSAYLYLTGRQLESPSMSMALGARSCFAFLSQTARFCTARSQSVTRLDDRDPTSALYSDQSCSDTPALAFTSSWMQFGALAPCRRGRLHADSTATMMFYGAKLRHFARSLRSRLGAAVVEKRTWSRQRMERRARVSSRSTPSDLGRPAERTRRRLNDA